MAPEPSRPSLGEAVAAPFHRAARFFNTHPALSLSAIGLALVTGLVVAILALDRQDVVEPPVGGGGLVVQTGRDDDIKLDERRPLRCFVGGQLVGELPLRDCAKKNGVASGALDVGLDKSGALAAANGVTPQITPLPPGQAADGSSAQPSPQSDDPAVAATGVGVGRVGVCWRYGEGEWTRLPEELPLGDCVRALYADQCGFDGPPAYGRWGSRTLRLLDGRIEISPDNRNFHPLAARNPGC